MKKTNRIKDTFARLREKGDKALITFITAGDPDLPTTKELILGMESAGADIIELGIPFSDPMADGPTIQASSERAVKSGTRLADVLSLVKDVRKSSQAPIVLFGYYNPIFNFGLKRFATEAARAGADGVLIVDLPADEADELKAELDRVGIDLIFLLTPTSTEERIKLISKKASGFIYYVSVTGVTGARARLSNDIKGHVDKVRKFTDLPLGVGFGISSPEQARKVSRFSDGVIVGSAIVNIIAQKSGSNTLVSEVSGFVKGLKDGISRG